MVELFRGDVPVQEIAPPFRNRITAPFPGLVLFG